jgi:hypothetical protein
MEYRFVHYWQYDPGKEEEKILESAISLSTKERTDNYLYEVAEFISEHLNTRYVVIGYLLEDLKHLTTLAFINDKKHLENFTYPLKGTPCDVVVTQRFCYHPYNVSISFPEDKDLKELQIESYLGSILLASDNEPLGVVALMDVKKIENAAFAEHLILVLSPSIEEEIKRIKSKNPSSSQKQ